MPPIHRLAFVVNHQKSGAPEVAADLKTLAEAHGVQVTESTTHPIPEGFLEGFDACCVIGGDGTLLGVVAEAARSGVPVIGVNRGSLGFLTIFSAEEARHCLPELLTGGFNVVERGLLSCQIGPHHSLALNDVVIKEAGNSRLVRLCVKADRELVTDYLCDGLIFSSPTGSTAYNLSAGGPLIHPGAEVIAMTPICPHTLSNRAIIFRQNVHLEVTSLIPQSSLTVAADGIRLPSPSEGQAIRIALAPRPLRLVQRSDHSHFAVVRTKLQWSGAAAADKRT